MLWAEWGAKEALAPLAESQGGRLVVEHWDRLTEFGFEMVEAALAGTGSVRVLDGEAALARAGQARGCGGGGRGSQ